MVWFFTPTVGLCTLTRAVLWQTLAEYRVWLCWSRENKHVRLDVKESRQQQGSGAVMGVYHSDTQAQLTKNHTFYAIALCGRNQLAKVGSLAENEPSCIVWTTYERKTKHNVYQEQQCENKYFFFFNNFGQQHQAKFPKITFHLESESWTLIWNSLSVLGWKRVKERQVTKVQDTV